MALARGISARTIEHPVFLIGSERSGTTLLRLMLDHHPDIAFNSEAEFLVSELSDAGAFPDVPGYRRRLAECRTFRHCGFHIPEDLDFRALVNDFLYQRLERGGKRIVGATLHHGFSKLRYLWPGARYLYLLRDGRDVARSAVEMGWAGNAYVGARFWMDAEREWADYRQLLARDQWMEVRYEELVADPEAQLRRVCEFVGVTFSERMFDYTKTTTYSRPDPRESSKWRRCMRPRELRLVEARIGSQLAARGYPLSGEAPARVGRLRARWIHWQSRLGALRYRLATFGLRLSLIESLSRRLGWPIVHSRAQRAIDAIIDQHLK
jgi:hypothetical protein